MTRKIRWGLLSTARINRAVIPPIRASARCELSAVASRDLQKAQDYAKEWQIPKTYGSYEELLADPEIDVIYNPLPNALHGEWSLRAAWAGKHVLCEKPLDVSLHAVDALITAASENKVVIAEAFMYRHHPLTHQVQAMVANGELGRLRYIYGAFTYYNNRPKDVRWDPDLGGGSIWDVGCYPISYTRALLGEEPVEVFGWQQIGPSGVDETFTGQMRFASGVIAQFLSSFRLPAHAYMEARGEQGSFRLTQPFRIQEDAKLAVTKDDQRSNLPIPPGNPYEGEIEDMASAILDGKPPRVTLQDSRNNLKTILALIESAKTGEPISLAG